MVSQHVLQDFLKFENLLRPNKKAYVFPPRLHIQIVVQYWVSHGSSNTLHGGHASTKQAQSKPSKSFSVLFISLWPTVNLFVVFVTLFFFCSSANVQLQQTIVQTVADCLETCWAAQSCLTTADTININMLAHTQTVTVKHDGVRPFDLVWLLTAAFYTTGRKGECVSEREIKVISSPFKTPSSGLHY